MTPEVSVTTIKILNPFPDGASHIGLERAERYVRAGRAEFTSAARTAIRFREQHHANVSALESALGYQRITRMLKPHELRGIPVIAPYKLYLL